MSATPTIAFLRGINVGGHKIILMTDLKKIFEDMGYQNVRTFIQSGNVIFDSSETNTAKLTRNIETGFSKALGYDVPVIIRTVDQLAALLKLTPFTHVKTIDEHSRFNICFLAKPPTEEARWATEAMNNKIETIEVKGENAFLYFNRKDLKKLKLFTKAERKLGVAMTVRKWETMERLMEFAKQKTDA